MKEGAEEDVPRRSNDSKRAESRAGSERRMERWKEGDSPLVRAPQVCEIGRRDSLARDLCAATRRPQPSSCRSTFGVPLVNLRQLPSRCDWLKLVSARLGLHDAQAKREYRQTSLSHRFHASSLSLSLSLSSSLILASYPVYRTQVCRIIYCRNYTNFHIRVRLTMNPCPAE